MNITGFFWRDKTWSRNPADDYAVAAPNADTKDGSVLGSVYVCQNCFKDSFGTTIRIHGFQYGEKFGHSLCAVDVNGDGYDDLIVGAPLHSDNSQVTLNYHFLYFYLALYKHFFSILDYY